MASPRSVASAILVLSACGPDASSAAAICGQPPPVRVLATAADEEASLAGGLGDRLWFEVERFVRGVPYEGGVVESPGVVGIGMCGEDPRVVGESNVAFLDPVEELVLVRRFPGALQAVDPRAETITPVLDEVSHRAAITPHGVVATDRRDAIWLARRPLGTHTPERIGRDVKPYASEFLIGDSSFRVDHDELRYLDARARLWRVALASGEATLEQTDVTSFHTADDGSFVAFLSATGDVGVLLPATGETRAIGTADAYYATGRWVVLADDRTTTAHDVPAATTHSLDGTGVLPWAIDRERLFLYGAGELWTPTSGERTRLDMPVDELPRWVNGELWMHVWHEDERERALWRVPIDGSPRELVAARVSDWQALDDEVLLLWRITDEGDRALEVWSPEAPELLRLDVGVPRRIDAGVAFDLTGDGELIYAIAPGPRAGWWRTIVPPSW
jgi:hypothetical protein